MAGGRVRSLVRGGESCLRARGTIVSCTRKRLYGKAPTRQLHSIPIAVSGSGNTRKEINSLDAAIYMQESPPKKRQSRMQLAHPSCDSPNTLRRFATWCKQRLPGR